MTIFMQNWQVAVSVITAFGCFPQEAMYFLAKFTAVSLFSMFNHHTLIQTVIEAHGIF
jgi:hypothetical protein